MNFLFDRNQPVHLSFDTICGFFNVKKASVGGKATVIERSLRLRAHSEPGLCRVDILEMFTILRGPNGISLSLKSAKQLGYVPQSAAVEDFL